MKVSIAASGSFPVALYALGGNFMRASKLHECGAVMSLIEELRQLGEPCNVAKVAAVLFAGRTSVAHRILQPLIKSGLVVVDESQNLSVCEDAEVRKASLALSEVRFEPSERGYKLVLQPDVSGLHEDAWPLVLGYLPVEKLPRSLSSDRFVPVEIKSPINESVLCVSCQHSAPFMLSTDTDHEFLAFRHSRSFSFNIRYHFTQEQAGGMYKAGKLLITLEGDVLTEKHWGWLTGPLRKMAGKKGRWEVEVPTPADGFLFESLLRCCGCTLASVPGYFRRTPSRVSQDPYSSFYGRQSNLSVKVSGLREMPEDAEAALSLAIGNLASDARNGNLVLCPPARAVAKICDEFGYDPNVDPSVVEFAMKSEAANMDGAALSRFFASTDWSLSS